ncbi:hypothetical protein UYO_3140 [Lachnospiraceae bacterium JC7]|nr:hypothetical protein UYO_3140 [Lachnospiraceae bacterium JC7]
MLDGDELTWDDWADLFEEVDREKTEREKNKNT